MLMESLIRIPLVVGAFALAVFPALVFHVFRLVRPHRAYPVLRFLLWIWGVFVLVFYFLGPLRINTISAWRLEPGATFLIGIVEKVRLGLLPNLFVVAVYVMLTVLIGAVLTALGAFCLSRLLGIHTTHDAPFIATAFLIGKSLSSLIFLFLSLNGWLVPESILVVLAVAVVLGVLAGGRIWREALQNGAAAFQGLREEATLWKWVAGLSAVVLLASTLNAWSRLSYDAATAYFHNAALMASSHQLQYFNINFFIVSGFHTEVFNAAMLVVFNDRVARLSSWLVACAVVMLLLGIARQSNLDRRGRILLVAMALTTTAFLNLVGDGKTDLGGTAFALAALYWLLRVRTSQRIRILILVGIFCGLAVLNKPLYLVTLGPVVALYVIGWHATSANRLRMVGHAFFWIGLASVLVVSTHLARNILFSGHWNGADPQTVLGLVDTEGDWTYGAEERLVFVRIYPFFATFAATAQSLGTLTPLWLITLPLLLVVDTRHRLKDAPVILLSMIVLGGWLVFSRFPIEIRYVLPFWLLSYTANIFALQNLASRVRLERVAASVMIILLSLMLIRTIYGALASADWQPGSQQRVCRETQMCTNIEIVNTRAAESDRVLTLSPYITYLRDDLVKCVSTYEDILVIQEAFQASPAAGWQAIHALGFRWVPYSVDYSRRQSGLGFELDPADAPEWMTITTIEPRLDGENPLAVYHIDAADPPASIEPITCTP